MTPTQKLKWYAQGFESNDLQVIVERMIAREEFAQAPGSVKHHHCYTGGLAEHTLEVVDYCNNAMKLYANDADKFESPKYDILIGAAIIHDWAKIHDYEQKLTEATEQEEAGYVWANAPYKFSIHHIAGSHAEFYRQAAGVLHLPTMRAIEHCILSHHGRKEWGSPVEPQTPEALLLHQADIWSAHYGPGKDRSVYVG